MPNPSLDDLIIKPQPQTGRMRSFIPTTPWLDNPTISDANVDGVQIIKSGSTYYREAYPTGHTHRVNVLELGLVPDGTTRNELILAEAMSRLPQNTTYFFPASNRPYLFGALPPEYNNIDGHPVAINCDTSGAWFVGEGDNTTIQFLPGTAGFQVNGGLAPRITIFRDFNIIGAGVGAGGDGLNADGSPSDEYGKYIGNGINAYGQVLIDNVNVRYCSGHGVKIFGFSYMHVDGIPFSITGRMANAFYFYPDDASQLAGIGVGWKVNYQGVETYVINNEGIRLPIQGMPGMTPSEQATILVTPSGGPLIADNSDIIGGNFDFNGGCGIYIQGNDANQTRIWGGSLRENGYWGLADLSFLGTFCYGTHFTANGKSFNKFHGNNNNELVVGPYYTAFPTAFSGYFGTYTEGGNQGPASIGQSTMVVGGLQAAGVEGLGYWQDGKFSHNLVAGNVHFTEQGMRFYDGGGQPTTLRQWPWGTLGFGFGNPEDGQEPHPLLSLIREGDSIFHPRYTNDKLRTVRIYGTQIDTLYHGPFCHQVAETLTEALNLMGPDTPFIQEDTITLRGSANTPRKYTCYVGGIGTAAKWRPEGYGIGAVAARPEASTLTVNDTGWRWYDPATNQYTTFNGTQWG